MFRKFDFFLFFNYFSSSKRFTKKENLASTTQVKGSVQKQIRSKVLEQMPKLAPFIEDLLPKKSPIFLAKWYFYNLKKKKKFKNSKFKVTITLIL